MFCFVSGVGVLHKVQHHERLFNAVHVCVCVRGNVNYANALMECVCVRVCAFDDVWNVTLG